MSVKRTMTNRAATFVAVAACLVLGADPGRAADGRDFAGAYEARDVMDAGDAVVLTFSTRIFNYSGAAVESATLSLEDRLGVAPAYGSAVVSSLPAEASVRLDIEATLPRSEYEAWQEGIAPRLTIEYLDGDGNTVTARVELSGVRLDQE